MSYSIKLGSEVLVSTATFAFNLPYLGKGLLQYEHYMSLIIFTVEVLIFDSGSI